MGDAPSHQDDVRNLEQLTLNDEQRKNLNRLQQDAKTGARLKWWINRLMFGFRLADAVERWLIAFDPQVGKPIKDQIPQAETKEVVASWAKFSMKRSITLFFLSTVITVITAGALFWQIKKQDVLINKQDALIDKQDVLIKLQREKNVIEERFLYTQILYDQICEEKLNDEGKKDCKPKYNHRQRTDAAINYLKMGLDKDLSGALLEGVNMVKVDLENVDLSGANFNEAILFDANFLQTRLRGASLRGADLRTATLIRTDLFGADLRNANLFRANLFGAVLDGANLHGANLSKTMLNRSKIGGARLIGANLSEANLFGANLNGANLSGANLNQANLNKADLSSTNLNETNLSEANLVAARFDNAKYNSETQFPIGFNPEEHGMIRSGLIHK